MILNTFGKIYYLPFNNAIPLYMSPPKQRGNYMAWFWMTWSLASIIGSIGGFKFIEYFGFTAFWITMITFVAISLTLTLRQQARV